MKTNHNQDENVQRFIEIDGEQIPVTEEIYRAYKRPLWREHKEKERAKRCRDEKGNRCTKSCRECPKLRDGGDLSFERFIEDGFEIADSVDIAELIADKLLLEQLLTVLDESEKSLMFSRFVDGLTQDECAADIGISRQAVAKREKKALNKLRKEAGIEDK